MKKKGTQRLHCVQQPEGQGSQKRNILLLLRPVLNQRAMCPGEYFERYDSEELQKVLV
jgi:hypothetical protein